MKKVLIFSLSYYPRFIGGAEVAIKEITDRIPPEEIEFHLLTLRFDSTLPRMEKIGNVLVHRIGFATHNPSISDLRRFPLHLNKHLYQFLATLHALRLHKKHHYDGMWAMMAHSCGIPAGMMKALHPELRYLLTLQEGDPPESIERLMRPVWPLFAQGFRRADALQAISTFLLSWGKRMGFRGEGEVIPNAVETRRFARSLSPEERKAAEQRFGKKAGETWLVTVSRLVHKNAVDTVIRALPRISQEVVLVVAGIGPDEAKLRSLTHELDVADRVRFLGEVSQAELPSLLAISDIFTRPSRSEGMGISFIEAMAAGLPIIATQEGGIVDFLFDAKRNPGKETTGWAVDVDAPEQIGEAVRDILAHPKMANDIARRAQARTFKLYDWDLIAKDMRTLFGRLMGEALA